MRVAFCEEIRYTIRLCQLNGGIDLFQVPLVQLTDRVTHIIEIREVFSLKCQRIPHRIGQVIYIDVETAPDILTDPCPDESPGDLTI